MMADVYDALTSARVYKPAYSHKTARDLILKGCGKQFDPDIVKVFLRREDEFQEICQQMDSVEAGSLGATVSPASQARPALV
jgi:HD-GYP domain-containing protein (c-di-GMP phosphodiesterase class II)